MKVCLLFIVVLCMFHLTHAFQVYVPDCIDLHGNVLECTGGFTCQKDINGVGECVFTEIPEAPSSACPSPEEIEAQEEMTGQVGNSCTSDLDCSEEQICCATNSGTRCSNFIAQTVPFK
ncbi:hypothetical protein ACJMK2_038427 [Sinanodonta woodiana]|uniref:WAP domain-containing protein n=1 Tax=Sinanodonta woodiana TaxID=1069815 RepID=A0ABD3W8Z5_SINWO